MKQNLLKLYHFSNSWTGTIIIVLMIVFFVAQAFVIPSGSMISTLLIGDHLFVKKFAYGVPTPHIPFLEIPLMKNENGHLIDGEKPKKGDIVIFRYPLNQKVHFVKRCVATEGDQILFHNKTLYLRPKNGDSDIKKDFAGYETVMINGVLWVKSPFTKEHRGIHISEPIITDFLEFGPMAEELSSPAKYFEQNSKNEVQFENQLSMLNDMEIKKRKYYFGPYTVPDGKFFMMGDNRDNSADSRFWGAVDYADVVGKPWFIYFSWDDDYKVRWERIGKSIDTLEQSIK